MGKSTTYYVVLRKELHALPVVIYSIIEEYVDLPDMNNNLWLILTKGWHCLSYCTYQHIEHIKASLLQSIYSARLIHNITPILYHEIWYTMRGIETVSGMFRHITIPDDQRTPIIQTVPHAIRYLNNPTFDEYVAAVRCHGQLLSYVTPKSLRAHVQRYVYTGRDYYWSAKHRRWFIVSHNSRLTPIAIKLKNGVIDKFDSRPPEIYGQSFR